MEQSRSLIEQLFDDEAIKNDTDKINQLAKKIEDAKQAILTHEENIQSRLKSLLLKESSPNSNVLLNAQTTLKYLGLKDRTYSLLEAIALEIVGFETSNDPDRDISFCIYKKFLTGSNLNTDADINGTFLKLNQLLKGKAVLEYRNLNEVLMVWIKQKKRLA